MLTSFQTTEPQATLVTCPRPRALASFAGPAVDGSFNGSAARGYRAAWLRTATPIAASARRLGSVAERPSAGFSVTRVLADVVRVQPAGNGTALNSGNGTALGGMNSTTQLDPQDKQHLTDRRETVTWRPPH